jgi:uncharacterized RDD family membrane protein YckC
MTEIAPAHGLSLEPVPAPAPTYEGLVTRAIAFSIDAALINLVALVVGVAVGQALTVLSISDTAETAAFAAGGVVYVIWTIAYFVTFWSTTGQTPGDRLLQIRVCRAADGHVVRPTRALIRLAGMVLATIPLGAGFLPILVDDRRRGLHDMLAGTVVVTAPGKGPARVPRPGPRRRRAAPR